MQVMLKKVTSTVNKEIKKWNKCFVIKGNTKND